MAYQASGRLHKIFDTEQKSANFQAREFVIEVQDGQYPQMIKFQLVQDKCNLIDGFSEGDMIDVDFDLRGREWNERFFTNLQAWRISHAGEASGGGAASGAASGPASGAAPAGGGAASGDFDDDIPF
ncbi:MAG: hypothetical protein CSA54_05110 [Gammaproteobacteria bacterium]|nr:MAG: hypothetical protein CSA54_05110 [Gammaproteobacteria bacterium]